MLFFTLLFCVVSLSFSEQFHIKSNLMVFYHELFTKFPVGYWGYIWWEMAILYIGSCFLRRDKGFDKKYNLLFPIFILLLLCLGAFRSPFYVNYMDSANRMFAHILPTLLFYLAVNALATLQYYRRQGTIQSKKGMLI